MNTRYCEGCGAPLRIHKRRCWYCGCPWNRRELDDNQWRHVGRWDLPEGGVIIEQACGTAQYHPSMGTIYQYSDGMPKY